MFQRLRATAPQTYDQIVVSRHVFGVAKTAGSGRLQILIHFLLKSDRFGAVSASGKPGADLGRFRAVPKEDLQRTGKADRDEVGGKSTRRSGTPPRRRPGRHPRLDDDDEPDDKTTTTLRTTTATTKSTTFRDDLHSTCSVSRGRFRISIRSTSDPFDFAARPKRDLLRGRGRRYRRGRDRWSRRAVVVAITIVTISEKSKRRRSRSHNAKPCAITQKRKS